MRTAAILTLMAALLVLAQGAAWSAQPIQTYSDTVGDNPAGRAQDITSARIEINASQVITTRVNTSRPSDPNLQLQDYIVLYLDTNPNSPGEGSGPEYRISVSGGGGTTAALLERWVGPPGTGHWETYTPASFSGQFAPGGMEARFLRVDLGIGNAFRFHAISRWNGEAQYDDWLPNDTQARLTYDVVAPVTVTKSGTGMGTVRSSPAGIDCGATCTANFVLAGSVTLQALPDAATSDFAGWGGACSGSSSICTVTVDDAKAVTAQFALGSQVLTVAKSGRGKVTSSPGGIACGSVCDKSFPRSSVVSLTAKPAPGARFRRWSGCSGRGQRCSVQMTSDQTVRAIFAQYPHVSLSWRYVISGNTVRLDGIPRPKAAAVSFRCVRSCTLLSRGGKSAKLLLRSGFAVEMRATKRGSIGASRLIKKGGGGLVSAQPKCLRPGSRGRPVSCRSLGVG